MHLSFHSILFEEIELFLLLLYFHCTNLSGSNFFFEILDKCIQGSLAFVAFETAADCHYALFLFLLAYNQHIRNLVLLGFTNLVADLFRADIQLCTASSRAAFTLPA